MWTYVQKTGELLKDGKHVAYGYSGHGPGLNNPEMQSVHDVGPLPCGKYTFGHPENHPHLGPYSIPLIADPTNNMFGRSGFFCHGERVSSEPGQASHGCIILPRDVRETIWNSGDRDLEVIAELAVPKGHMEEGYLAE